VKWSSGRGGSDDDDDDGSAGCLGSESDNCITRQLRSYFIRNAFSFSSLAIAACRPSVLAVDT